MKLVEIPQKLGCRTAGPGGRRIDAGATRKGPVGQGGPYRATSTRDRAGFLTVLTADMFTPQRPCIHSPLSIALHPKHQLGNGAFSRAASRPARRPVAEVDRVRRYRAGRPDRRSDGPPAGPRTGPCGWSRYKRSQALAVRSLRSSARACLPRALTALRRRPGRRVGCVADRAGRARSPGPPRRSPRHPCRSQGSLASR